MNEVDRVFKELGLIREYLNTHEAGISIINSLSEFDAKVLLLCSAIFFERKICDNIINISRENFSSKIMVSFIENQAINRKYHTLFSWDSKNINHFLSLFGKDLKEYINNCLDDSVRTGMVDFLEIGSERNRLVHNNYATFTLNYTIHELHDKFLNANRFIDFLFIKISDFENKSEE